MKEKEKILEKDTRRTTSIRIGAGACPSPPAVRPPSALEASPSSEPVR